jgi:hypothetical protein
MNKTLNLAEMSFADMLTAAFVGGEGFPKLAQPKLKTEAGWLDIGLTIESQVTKRLFTIGSLAQEVAGQVYFEHNRLHETTTGEVDPAECAKAMNTFEHFNRIIDVVEGLLMLAAQEEHTVLIDRHTRIVDEWQIVCLDDETAHVNTSLLGDNHITLTVLSRLKAIFTTETLENSENRASKVQPEDDVIGHVKDVRTRAVFHLFDELYAEADFQPEDSIQHIFISQVCSIVLRLAWVLVEDEVPITDEQQNRAVCKDWEVIAGPPVAESSITLIVVGRGPDASK